MRRPYGDTRSGKQIPTPTTVDEDYDPATLEVSEGLVRYYGWLLHRISGSIHGRTLEVGAGIGTLSARVEPLCTDLTLVEPAANLCRHLEQRFADMPNVNSCNGTLERAVADYPDQFEPGFDTIVSFNVLEHIEDDVGTLRTAATLLRPGAHLVLFVPSLPFLYGTVDAEINHYRRYTKMTLSEAVRSAGLTLQRIEYFDFLGIVPWFISSRVLRRTPSDSGIRSYDRFVVPVCRAFDRLIGPPLGKSLIAVAGPAGRADQDG
jgi:SAM-dependent methyltransferase